MAADFRSGPETPYSKTGTESPIKRKSFYLNRGFGTTSTPTAITCPQYQAMRGSRRCMHYLASGACKLPAEFICTEYLKRNGYANASGTLQASVPAIPRIFAQPKLETPPERSGALTAHAGKTALLELALELGGTQLHLVSGYTPAPRMELSWEHAATLRRILDAFPGAQLVGFGPDLPPSSSPPGEQP